MLRDKLQQRIRAHGPISVHDFINTALLDEEHGYYRTKNPLGRSADFITAPEVSQLFGELIGIWLVHSWQNMGLPTRITLAECGPGKGTMMADILRIIRQFPACMSAISNIQLIEVNPVLREAQQNALASFGIPLVWHNTIQEIAGGGMPFIFGNEYLDALPIHQCVMTEQGWRERGISVDAAGHFYFTALDNKIGIAVYAQEEYPNAKPGEIAEYNLHAEADLHHITRFIAERNGAALFFDYGYMQPAHADTLQAIQHHRYTDIFDDMGNADITAHVDFYRLMQRVNQYPMITSHTITQREFLLCMGIMERCHALAKNITPEQQTELELGVDRLISPAQMGDLFKVMAIYPQNYLIYPFIKA